MFVLCDICNCNFTGCLLSKWTIMMYIYATSMSGVNLLVISAFQAHSAVVASILLLH